MSFLPIVSLIIPIYNGEFDLPDLINCLLAQTYPSDLVEYLLVDNASSDATANIIKTAAEEAKSQAIDIRYLSENQIQSSYAARNFGIRSAKGEFLVFTDVDCRPQPNWLYDLVQPFIRPEIGLVAGSIGSLPGKTLLEQYAAKNNPLSVEDGLSYDYCPYIVTANLAVRREVFQQLGLFRSHLTTGGDVDFSWRVFRQNSWQYYYAEKAIVLHRHRATLRALRSQWRRYGRSYLYLHELHGMELMSKLSFKRYLYSIIMWLLTLPLYVIKIVFGKADFVDIFNVPIKLLLTYEEYIGQTEAIFPLEAKQIPQL